MYNNSKWKIKHEIKILIQICKIKYLIYEQWEFKRQKKTRNINKNSNIKNKS